MGKSGSTWTYLLCTLTSCGIGTSAEMSGDFFEVVSVTPSRVIEHEVDVKGPFDDKAMETLLSGPVLFSHAVGVDQTAAKEPKACLNWYRIERPAKESPRTLTVSGSLEGGKNEKHEMTIASPAFLLSPAQRLTSGTPDPVPEGLSYFKAYRIDDAKPIKQSVKLNGAFGPKQRTAAKAVFLCVPVEEWHHDEHFPVESPQDCLIVYELQPHQCEASVATIDQFGLNKLQAKSSNWLCLRAKIVKPGGDVH